MDMCLIGACLGLLGILGNAARGLGAPVGICDRPVSREYQPSISQHSTAAIDDGGVSVKVPVIPYGHYGVLRTPSEFTRKVQIVGSWRRCFGPGRKLIFLRRSSRDSAAGFARKGTSDPGTAGSLLTHGVSGGWRSRGLPCTPRTFRNRPAQIPDDERRVETMRAWNTQDAAKLYDWPEKVLFSSTYKAIRFSLVKSGGAVALSASPQLNTRIGVSAHACSALGGLGTPHLSRIPRIDLACPRFRSRGANDRGRSANLRPMPSLSISGYRRSHAEQPFSPTIARCEGYETCRGALWPAKARVNCSQIADYLIVVLFRLAPTENRPQAIPTSWASMF
ncbi:uncharacterized protein BDZ83DRAFT_768459 [Colletotrichum acutatum]|uniref:Uncharacterized protein n=1 Tax=Glomerella acutata TaxID=27357 RepID=A0AAD8XQD3_GLOAC|nr:uncharacterized protein BDZ83DRAFT_768459 [Colletotrichum acutatum]KAK1731566.1 hypothetical protein BDZ83DRAFT_768459 [Colletotrichum acutatum]